MQGPLCRPPVSYDGYIYDGYVDRMLFGCVDRMWLTHPSLPPQLAGHVEMQTPRFVGPPRFAGQVVRRILRRLQPENQFVQPASLAV